MLLTQNVTTDVPKANHSERTPGEGVDDIAYVRPGKVAAGTLQCESWRTYTSRYEISILRVNRQIYREAWGIFYHENFWTLVRINKVGFGKEMKDRGFAVATTTATTTDMGRNISFPVLKTTVIFPWLAIQPKSDTFLIATVYLEQLIRALWTVKGASKMEVTIDVQASLLMKNSPSERDLLRPFLKLHSVMRVTLFGVSKKKYTKELTRKITNTSGIDQTLGELTASIKHLRGYIKTQRWGSAIAIAEKHAILMSDYHTVYGARSYWNEPGLDINIIQARRQAFMEIMLASNIGFAEVTLYQRRYASTVGFANRVLIDVAFIQTILPAKNIVAVLPSYKLVPILGTITTENEIKGDILLIRAQAYIEIGQAAKAWFDIEKARDLIPSSVTLVSVSQTWEATFGLY